MLKEFKDVRQIPNDPPRRWFNDDYFDLIVWLDPDGKPRGFQLCYDRHRHPRALTWTRAGGYKHSGIDDGEIEPGTQKSTPILVADGVFDGPGITGKFEAESAELPADIRDFTLSKLREYKL